MTDYDAATEIALLKERTERLIADMATVEKQIKELNDNVIKGKFAIVLLGSLGAVISWLIYVWRNVSPH